MIFLYSRKSQCVLLLCWLIGMIFMYVQLSGTRQHRPVEVDERAVDSGQKVRLGEAPELPVQEAPPARETLPVPPSPARPAADPELNRCLALRVEQGTGGHEDTLTLELDYVAAQTKGFSIEKARSYYLEDEAAFVVALGEPWISDVGNLSFPGTMPQVTGLKLIVSKSRNLRLLVHTRSMNIAREAKLQLSPTDTGIRAEIRLRRQSR
jgi:hypothetical protein